MNGDQGDPDMQRNSDHNKQQENSMTNRAADREEDEPIGDEGYIIFKKGGRLFVGKAIGGSEQRPAVQVLSRLTPQGKHRNTWVPTWIQWDKARNTKHYMAARVKPENTKYVEYTPITTDLQKGRDEMRRTSDPSAQKITDGRQFPAYSAPSVAFMLKDTASSNKVATTHQKVRYSKLEEPDKTRAMEAFNKEMQKFREWDVYESVTRRSAGPQAK